MPKNPKGTAARVAAHIDQVVDLLLTGASRREVLRYCSENDWDCSSRTIDTYLARAANIIAAELGKDREYAFAFHVARRRQLGAKADQVGDYRTALACAKDEAQLLGLYPPKGVEVTGTFATTNVDTEADLFDRARKLAGQIRAGEIMVEDPAATFARVGVGVPDRAAEGETNG